MQGDIDKMLDERTRHCFVLEGKNCGDGIGAHFIHGGLCPNAYARWYDYGNTVNPGEDPHSLEDGWVAHFVARDGYEVIRLWADEYEKISGMDMKEVTGEWAVIMNLPCAANTSTGVGQETFFICDCAYDLSKKLTVAFQDKSDEFKDIPKEKIRK